MTGDFMRELLDKVASSLGMTYEEVVQDWRSANPPPTFKEPDPDRTRIIAGGIMGGRPLDTDDAFEVAVNAALGDEIRASDAMAAEAWGAITGVEWIAPDATVWAYTYRAAGDIVAAVRGSGDYIAWYCSGPVFEQVIPAWISDAMAAQGWRWMVSPDR